MRTHRRSLAAPGSPRVTRLNSSRATAEKRERRERWPGWHRLTMSAAADWDDVWDRSRSLRDPSSFAPGPLMNDEENGVVIDGVDRTNPCGKTLRR
jgi:hypothetical protein